MQQINIFWFRRDLRLDDNAGLYHALTSGLPVQPIFIFDRNILGKLEDKNDRRVQFIHDAITALWLQLKKLNSNLEVYYGTPSEVFKQILKKYSVHTVFANHDYEPYGKERDAAIAAQLKESGAGFQTYKDVVVQEKNEVLKDDGLPYTVYTPYSKKWLSQLTPEKLQPFASEKQVNAFVKTAATPLPSMAEIGFTSTSETFPGTRPDMEIIKKYNKQRDIPGINSTSKLGVHLRFGTISIRRLMAIAQQHSATFMNELIWREFYQAILWHFPHVGTGRAFKKPYDQIPWLNNEELFEKWCAGQTGYPIVDAGMRELKATGFMHNRVRMVTASFLVKHLLTDWRWGEAWFARYLLDFELASNNGGWQWAAGSGCDAAPYFRIFNPYLQTKKFDPDLVYIRKWVPELDSFNYPQPVVEHEFARKRCLEVFTKTLQ